MNHCFRVRSATLPECPYCASPSVLQQACRQGLLRARLASAEDRLKSVKLFSPYCAISSSLSAVAYLLLQAGGRESCAEIQVAAC